jgi:phage tail sheath gpL-like
MAVALVAPKSSAGDLTVDTEVRTGAGEASASVAFGPGTVGHQTAKQIWTKYPASEIDFIAPTAGAGSATLDLTFANSPTSNITVYLDIHGVEFEVAWLAGESADDIRDTVISAINERTSQLMVAASTGGTGIVTITAKIAGNVGNDILIYASLSEQSGTETINSGTSVSSALSGGSSDPDLTNALAALSAKEYDIILPCLSNTDVANTASTNNLKRIVNHISAYNSGLNAKLQQFVVGYTGTVALAVATSSHSNSANNVDFGEIILCIAGRDLPSVLAGREVADWLVRYSSDPSANRIGQIFDGIVGAKDKLTNTPTDAELQTLIGNGVSPISYTKQLSPKLVRPVTTHSQDDAGGADRRVLDVQNVVAEYVVARDIRDTLPSAFPQAKISEDLAEGEEPVPGVTEVRDVKAWLGDRLMAWADDGVLNKARVRTVISDGSLIVQVNGTDATQVDIVLPKKIVQPWAKTSLVSQREPS